MSLAGEDHWGEVSKYADADFGHDVRRLNVSKCVVYDEPSTSSEGRIGELVIRNTSTLPMTYKIVDLDLPEWPESNNPNKITASPDIDWIPPNSVKLIEIRLTGKYSDSEIPGRVTSYDIEKWLPHSAVFAIYGTPLFRERHAEQANLELFWKGFGTEMFPYSHAEVHVTVMAVSPLDLEGEDVFKVRCQNGEYDLTPPSWIQKLEHASPEEFNSLWIAGDDNKEYAFSLEFRLKELQRVTKRRDLSNKEYDDFTKTLISLCALLFGILIALLFFIFYRGLK